MNHPVDIMGFCFWFTKFVIDSLQYRCLSTISGTHVSEILAPFVGQVSIATLVCLWCQLYLQLCILRFLWPILLFYCECRCDFEYGLGWSKVFTVIEVLHCHYFVDKGHSIDKNAVQGVVISSCTWMANYFCQCCPFIGCIHHQEVPQNAQSGQRISKLKIHNTV